MGTKYEHLLPGARGSKRRMPPARLAGRQVARTAALAPTPRCEACLETVRHAIRGDVELRMRALWGLAHEYERYGDHDRATALRSELAALADTAE